MLHSTSGPLSIVFTNSPFFVAIAPRTISTRYARLTRRSGGGDRESSGAAGHFLSESLPRRAPPRARNRALACTLHAPSALCRERRESDRRRIPARRRAHPAPEPRVTKVRKRYRVAPRSMVDTNRSLSRWGKRRTENRATQRPDFSGRSRRLSAENAVCSVSLGVQPRRAPSLA
jgi:hypothetical protein